MSLILIYYLFTHRVNINWTSSIAFVFSSDKLTNYSHLIPNAILT